MSSLIAEEGPLVGLQISLDEGDEWVLGRDPDVATAVLEDPMVSRQHVIVRREGESYIVENLSSTNPALINGESVIDPVSLTDGDRLQVGGTIFRYSSEAPVEEILEDTPEEDSQAVEDLKEQLSSMSIVNGVHTRWLLKVIAGPNTGAEFGMEPSESYVLGKDPNSCDIFFQDLSVSRQHAKVTLSADGTVSIEDLNSRNGILVRGNLIEGPKELKSQDQVSMGTTSFIVIDRQESDETLYSTPSEPEVSEEKVHELEEEVAMRKNWKAMVIPKRHLIFASCFGILVLIGLFGVVALFKSEPIQISHKMEENQLASVMEKFPEVEYTFNPTSGKLLLIGHVLTDIDHQELVYLLKSKPFITDVENSVVIDEYVWESMNALLFKNPAWRSVMITGPKPGQFLLKGYLQSNDEVANLIDYVNANFPYLDRLKNEVVVDTNMETAVQALLIEKGFVNVSFKFTNGELVLAGRVHVDEEHKFDRLIDLLQKMQGITNVKNFVIFTGASTSRVDLTGKFTVSGTSKTDNVNEFVLINGQILSKGDKLEGMTITEIAPGAVLLEKDGLKYKIDYNL